MTDIESSQALQTYLNPDYWGGHSIGHGGPLKEWPEMPMFGRALRHSVLALKGRIALMKKVVPIETYNDSQVFDVEQQELGTVVIFRVESLFGHPGKLEVDMESLEEQPLPVRPFDVSPSFGQEASTGEVISDGSAATYLSIAKWGIVGTSKKRHKALYTAGTAAVSKREDGRVLLSNLDTLQAPVVIGETRHYIGGKYGHEKLERINVLDVVACGEAERKKKGVTRFAAKLALGRSTA